MSQYHQDEVPIQEPVKEAFIQFHYVDKMGETVRTFESVHRLADFLKYNPVLGKMVGYIPKSKK
jgi:hypothetical protein